MAEPPPHEKVAPVITPILDEYLKWYGAVYMAVIQKSQAPSNPAGSVLKNFLTTISQEHFITKERGSRILAEQKNMLAEIQSGSPKSFQKKFEIFYATLRELERDCVREDHGLDYLTGLKSQAVLYDDIRKELEKLSRKGQPFSMALVQIDHYYDIIEDISDESTLENTCKIARLVQDCVRNFDEAYRSGPGEFTLLIKQTDISGGLAALERLNNSLEKLGLQVQTSEGQITLSISGCIAEPVSHDTPEDLMKNLRIDIKNRADATDKKTGTILEYNEMSPLQRYLQEERQGQEQKS